MSRLSWRRQPNEIGLRAVCQSERDFELRYAGEILGTVARYKGEGFYFYGCGVNTLQANVTYSDLKQAKSECKNHVLSSDYYKRVKSNMESK